MPGISAIKILAHAKFASAMMKQPTDDSWEKPSGDPDAEQFDDSTSPVDNPPDPPKVFPPYFSPQVMCKWHQQSCNEVGEAWKKFVEAAIDAVKFSHDLWKLQAKVKDLKVVAICAIGAPGCLDGPALKDNIKNAPSWAPLSGDHMDKYKKAVAEGVSKCFEDWQGKVTVPGLPWYPAFAAFPGPQMVPSPNIPMPLITCPSALMTAITLPATLKAEIVKALDGGVKQEDPDKQYETAFDAIATALALAFLMWLPSQQVRLRSIRR